MATGSTQKAPGWAEVSSGVGKGFKRHHCRAEDVELRRGGSRDTLMGTGLGVKGVARGAR